MKKTGILNGQLMQQIASLGHTDQFLIGDAGMPVPAGVPIIDLVLTLGVPTFEQVLRAICDEVVVESAVIAAEIDQKNPHILAIIKEVVKAPIQIIPHPELKLATHNCKFAIRTGESTPYANIIIQAGVSFAI